MPWLSPDISWPDGLETEALCLCCEREVSRFMFLSFMLSLRKNLPLSYVLRMVPGSTVLLRFWELRLRALPADSIEVRIMDLFPEAEPLELLEGFIVRA